MPHDEDAFCITVMLGDIGMYPCNGRCRILDKGGKAHARCLAIIGNDRDKTPRCKSTTQKAVAFAFAITPRAAMEKDQHHRTAIGIWLGQVDIKLLPRIIAICDIRHRGLVMLGRTKCHPVGKIQLLWIGLAPEPKTGTNQREQQCNKDIFDHPLYLPVKVPAHNEKGDPNGAASFV